MIATVNVSDQGRPWTVPKRVQDPRPGGYIMPTLGPSEDMGVPSISFPLVSRVATRHKPAESAPALASEQVLFDRPVVHVIPVYIIVVILLCALSAVHMEAVGTGILLATPVWSVAVFLHACAMERMGAVLGGLLLIGWPALALLDDMGYTIVYILVFACFVSDHFWELRGLALVTSAAAFGGLLGGVLFLQRGNQTMPLACSSSLVLAVMCSRRLVRIRFKLVVPRIPVNEPV